MIAKISRKGFGRGAINVDRPHAFEAATEAIVALVERAGRLLRK